MPSFRLQFPPPLRFLATSIAVAFALNACDPSPEAENPEPGGLARVGTQTILESDLEHRIQEHHQGKADPQTREAALEELVMQAQYAQAAIDAGLADDPVVKAELSRLLGARLRELQLEPQLAAAREIPDEELRALYESQSDRFLAPEKRRVAVLWLNSRGVPERETQHQELLEKARRFVLESVDLSNNPAKGFAGLSADFSEHHATRYKGGVVGWISEGGSLDRWTKAVASIAFDIEESDGMSQITSNEEGTFLVRLIDTERAVQRPFEQVLDQLKLEEANRRQQLVRESFQSRIRSQHPASRPNAEATELSDP